MEKCDVCTIVYKDSCDVDWLWCLLPADARRNMASSCLRCGYLAHRKTRVTLSGSAFRRKISWWFLMHLAILPAVDFVSNSSWQGGVQLLLWGIPKPLRTMIGWLKCHWQHAYALLSLSQFRICFKMFQYDLICMYMIVCAWERTFNQGFQPPSVASFGQSADITAPDYSANHSSLSTNFGCFLIQWSCKKRREHCCSRRLGVWI